MTGFNATVLLAAREDGKTFEMWDERVYTGSNTPPDSWTIPAGFATDFASIPAAVSWAIPKLGAYSLAAIVHDLLCEGLNDWHRAVLQIQKGKARYDFDTPAPLPAGMVVSRLIVRHSDGRVVPRPTANAVDTDAIFRKIARDYGTDPITAALLWVGVRWGALANPARREGWLRTAPKVLGLSLLFAPVLVPATVLALVGRGVLALGRQCFR